MSFNRIGRVKFGSIELPQIILGHLPFVGESYQGRLKNQEYLKRFSAISGIVGMMSRAVKYGVDVLSAPSPLDGVIALRYFKAIKEAEDSLNMQLHLIPCVGLPIMLDGRLIDVYRRWLTYLHFEKKMADGLKDRYINDPILQCREGWQKDFPTAMQKLKPYLNDEYGRLQIDFKSFDEALLQLRNYSLMFVELGSETDLLATVGRMDLLDELVEHVKRICSVETLSGVHHAGVSIPKIDHFKLRFTGYLTPINPMGVMMFPTQDLAVKAIKAANKPIIGIKPFAGGRVKPKEAFQYLFKEVGVKVCMIGAASKEELDEDIRTAQQILQ